MTLLFPHTPRYDPGERTLSVEDWDTGAVLEFTFAHDESPISTAEALYKRAKKQKRAAAYVEPLLEETREQMGYLEEVGASLELLEGYREPGDVQVLRQIQVVYDGDCMMGCWEGWCEVGWGGLQDGCCVDYHL